MSENITQGISTVLIVDDNVRNLHLLGSYLKNEGLKLEFAINGISALQWLKRMSFDLILLDIMMPDIDGYEVCSMIKKDPAFSDIPIVFITAKTDTASIVEAFRCGAVDYITKPFIKDELVARVNTQIRLKRSNDSQVRYINEINSKNYQITKSIEYAGLIQSAILTRIDASGVPLPDHFILFLPKDIVSGDFYWHSKIEDQHVVAVMDCSGHGVPAALMSVLGMTLLNEIVLRRKIIEPAHILEELREGIIRSLGQTKINFDVKDGLQGVVVVFSEQEHRLRYSGSYNSLIITDGKKITQLKTDRIPIGFFENQNSFTSHSYDLKEGEVVYLVTDGYYDQFGGRDDKKYKRRQFLDLLSNIHGFSMGQQCQILHDAHKEWKGSNEQTDDILVMGVKF